MLGESGSGKSSLSLRFSTDEFQPYTESTVGASFFETSMIYQKGDNDKDDNAAAITADDSDHGITANDGNAATEPQQKQPKTKVTFKIWDTAGQEKYHALASMYYRGAAAAILVFDISRTHSFRTLQRWVEELKAKGPSDIVVVLCGNKSDLDHSGDRNVSQQQATDYAATVGALYMETSAKDNTGVKEMFRQVAKKIIDDFPDRIIPKASDDIVGAASCINLGVRAQDVDSSSCC